MAVYKNQDELMNTNWQAKINEALAKGDKAAAAQYEQARNDKINSSSYTGKQTTTNNYSQYANTGSSNSSSSSASKASTNKNANVYNTGIDYTMRPDLAGQSVKIGDYTYTYNSLGGFSKAVKDGGKSATSADPTKVSSIQELAATNDYLQAAVNAAQQGQWDAVGVALNNYVHKSQGANEYGEYDRTTANAFQDMLSDVYKYNAGDYYDQLYEAAHAATSGNKYAGTDYHQDAIDAAQGGSWDDVLAALKARDDKTMNTGENYGLNSSDIYQMLLKLYGDQTEDYGGFSYDSRPQYYDDYQVKIDAALDKLLNRDAFSYTAADDPIFQQYQDMYTREGDRAMRNTLAEASARTGGLASTYAVTASQQANQYYMQQLADKVPELYQMAYQMYLDDINLQAQDLGLLQNASNTAYNRFRDTIADWYNDRDFSYGAYRDNVADQQWQTQFDYNAERDSIADQQWREQFDYNAGRDQIADSRYDNEWQYQLDRDAIADSRYETEWNYQVQQDQAAAARAAANATPKESYGDDVVAVAAQLGISAKEAQALKNIGSSAWTEALKALGVGVASNDEDVPINWASVREATGQRNIDVDELAELERQGIVESYVENGVRKFRRVKGGGGGQQLTAAAM